MELRKVIVDISGKKTWVGYLHCWGSDFLELNPGVGIYPIGIVERLDGSIKCIAADCITFVTPYEAKKDENKKD